MRALTGRDEMAFHDTAAVGPHGRLLALASAVGPEVAGDPALPEWEARLLALRSHLFGRRIEAEATCPDCGAGIALIFSADDLPRGASVPSGDEGPIRLSHLLALEASGVAGEAALRRLLGLLLGDEDQAAARLSGPTRAATLLALEVRAAGLGLEIGTACTDCGAPMVLPFDVAAFLDAEMRARADRLLDEVHRLASCYHWSEAEILSLPVARRQSYLRRILAAEVMGAAKGGAG